MGVDHGRGDIFVTQQLLNGADIVSGLKEVGSKGVPEGMAGDMFVDIREPYGLCDIAVEAAQVEVELLSNLVYGV